jgi:hypothetical protein
MAKYTVRRDTENLRRPVGVYDTGDVVSAAAPRRGR